MPSANRSVSVRITPIMVNGSGLVDAGVTASDPGIATCSDQPEGTMGISQLLPAGEVAQLVMFDTRVCLQAGQQYTVEVTHYGPTDGSTVINLDTVSYHRPYIACSKLSGWGAGGRGARGG